MSCSAASSYPLRPSSSWSHCYRWSSAGHRRVSSCPAGRSGDYWNGCCVPRSNPFAVPAPGVSSEVFPAACPPARPAIGTARGQAGEQFLQCVTKEKVDNFPYVCFTYQFPCYFINWSGFIFIYSINQSINQSLIYIHHIPPINLYLHLFIPFNDSDSFIYIFMSYPFNLITYMYPAILPSMTQIHSLISFIHSFIYLTIPWLSFIDSIIHLHIYTFIHSLLIFIHSFIHLSIHSPIHDSYSFIHTFIHLPIHPFSHS